jgi:hypothetical protein
MSHSERGKNDASDQPEKRDRFILARKTGQIYCFSNRDLTVILSYTHTGISEHGIFHGIFCV